MMAGDPGQGGATWAVLQYVLGLRQLGHDVHFVEPVPASKLRPARATLSDSTSASYFRAVVHQFDLEARATLLLQDSTTTVGGPYEALRVFAGHADLLVNISGVLTDH